MRQEMREIATPLKRIFPAVIFLSVALASLVTAWVAYVGVQDAARLKFEATADDALNRIESSIDLNLSLLTRDAGVLHDARRRRFRRSEFNQYYNALNADANFPGLRGIGFLRLMRTGDEAEVERDILNVARDCEAHLSRDRSALAHAAHDVRAVRSRQSRRHRLRHVHRSATARGIASGAQVERAARDRPSHARPGDRERADLSGLSRFLQDRDHAGGRNGRHAGSRRPPASSTPRFAPATCSIRRSAGRRCCRSMSKSTTPRSIRTICCSGRRHRRTAPSATHWRSRARPIVGGRHVAGGIPADVELHAAHLAVDRLPDRRGRPAARCRDSLCGEVAGACPRDRDQRCGCRSRSRSRSAT